MVKKNMTKSPSNFMKIFLNRLFAKGKVSITECVEIILNRTKKLSEMINKYDHHKRKNDWIAELQLIKNQLIDRICDDNMIGDAFCSVVYILENHQIIAPFFQSPEKITYYNKWKKGELDTPESFKSFENIFWKWKKNGRKKFIEKIIPYREWL